MKLQSTSARKYYFWVGLSLILIFTALDPAGTWGTGFFVRFLIWSVHISVLLLLLIELHVLLQTLIVFNSLNLWLKLIFSGVLGSMMFVPIGLGIDYVFKLDDWTGITRLKEAFPIALQEIKGVVLPSTITWVAINAPMVLQLNFKNINAFTRSTEKNQQAGDAVKDFITLVPTEIGRDIIYLRSELHYVRVVTAIGERLVLYNLKDAITDLEKWLQGIQTHRSYWVAKKHIRSLLNEKDQNLIHTDKDHRIPVSRRRLTGIKQFMRDN